MTVQQAEPEHRGLAATLQAPKKLLMQIWQKEAQGSPTLLGAQRYTDVSCRHATHGISFWIYFIPQISETNVSSVF
jgi:hypothetical protein